MATEKSAAKKTPRTTAKTTAKATKRSEADPAEPAAAEAGADETCRADKCKQPVRAKGYCRKHYIGWRRGKVGAKHRYRICSREGCRKPTLPNGTCEEHQKSKGEAAPAAA